MCPRCVSPRPCSLLSSRSLGQTGASPRSLPSSTRRPVNSSSRRSCSLPLKRLANCQLSPARLSAGIQASKIRWLSTPALGHVAPPASIEQPAAEPSKVKVPKPRKGALADPASPDDVPVSLIWLYSPTAHCQGEPGYCPPRRSITGQTLFERELVLPHAGGAIGANRVWMREQWELLDEEVQEVSLGMRATRSSTQEV